MGMHLMEMIGDLPNVSRHETIVPVFGQRSLLWHSFSMHYLYYSDDALMLITILHHSFTPLSMNNLNHLIPNNIKLAKTFAGPIQLNFVDFLSYFNSFSA